MSDVAERILRLTGEERGRLREQLRARGAVAPLAAYAGSAHPCAPTSFAQRRVLFLQGLDPAAAHYHTPLACRLSGPLEVDALRSALHAMVDRHAILRTTFPIVNGVPVQRVATTGSLHVPLLDLAARGPDEQRTETTRVFTELRSAPFDLANCPPVRATLVRLGPEDHELLLVFHHIAVDGWSLAIFSHELAEFYAAGVERRNPALPSPLVDFADFSAWQNDWLDSEPAREQVRYWGEQLVGLPELLALPIDRPRPATQTRRGGVVHFALPGELSERLSALAIAHSASPFMVLLAGFTVLLSRFSGQDDIVVGTPIANRWDELTHSVMGFFANSVLLRTRLRADQLLTEVIADVRATCTAAFANQDIPLDVIATELMPTRDLDRNPLYQVNFTLHNTPELVKAAGALTITEVPFDTGTSRFDLDLNIWRDDAGYAGYIEFASDLFDRATVQRLVDSFTVLLTALCADPAQTVRDIPIIEAAPRGLAGPVVAGDLSCIDAQIAARAADQPNAIAITSPDGATLSYRQFDDEVNRLSNHLRSRGVVRGDLVGVLLPRSAELVVALVAVARIGAACVVVDPGDPAPRRRRILLDSTMVALIGRSAAADSPVPVIDPADAAGASSAPPDRVHGLDDVLYVMYTSGSTGSPKGVAVAHRGVANYLRWFASVANLSDPRGVPLHSAAAVDLSVTSILGPLTAGGTIVLLPESITPGESLINWVKGGGSAPMLKLTPSHLRMLSRAGLTEQLSGHVDVLVVGGEALYRSDVEELCRSRPELRVVNEYGPTEVSVACVARDYDGQEPFEAVSIGHPIDNTVGYVLDERLRPVPDGVVGQLYVDGVGLAHGYHCRPASTASAFLPDPFSERPGARMYATGDRVRRLVDGSLQYVGRIDDQVKIRGNRVEVGEVRAALLACPGVRAAAVVAEASSEDHHQELVAYVEVQPADEGSGADGTSGALAEERRSAWRSMYASVYGPLSAADAGAEFAGWTDSYTGAALPAADMAQWRQAVVDRILPLHPKHVLEIGCGTGLILCSVAPHCLSYLGTDQSPEALAFVADRLASAPEVHDVRLEPAAAHEAADAVEAGHPVDTVVINSVVQYFPSASYARQVIEQCLVVMSEGGQIVIGDVRSLELLRLFHTSVALRAAAPGDRVAVLRARMARLDTHEDELCLSPTFFSDLVAAHPRISAARIEWRSAPVDNELTRFRYDVVLSVDREAAVGQPGRPRPAPAPRELSWAAEDGAGAIEAVLRAERPDALLVRGVPNARLAGLVAEQTALVAAHPADAFATVTRAADQALAARPRVPHPSELAELAARAGYELSLDVLPAGDDGRTAGRRAPTIRCASDAVSSCSPMSGAPWPTNCRRRWFRQRWWLCRRFPARAAARST
ncbi:non-ribosomal peptide synthetase [Jatrophihabitans lederbergiae]|uniref:Amino acid adenylation domain-containing protein n=1 Tax=Jatrophihabitans lederbergiae TaxID=3075547 RepID=A0ABU2JBE7_9ACTN|nr:amino acid adenylation domain-containing protein [Jatrophihabitans sp. DSM 44399]MDT0262310.1 amino acid adenylation domain-containing protein [Jatrophihabitans sp. DSM 44399]